MSPPAEENLPLSSKKYSLSLKKLLSNDSSPKRDKSKSIFRFKENKDLTTFPEYAEESVKEERLNTDPKH